MFEDNKENADRGPLSQDPVQDLIDEAEEHMDRFEYDTALQFCQRALDLDANNLAALELASGLFLEAGDNQKAKSHLDRAVLLSPDKGHSKYLSLAQLHEGKDALKCYLKGIEIIKNELRLLDKDTKEEIPLRLELSNAYCATAELFTTDLCDEPDAEEQCLKYADEALTTDSSNPEAYLINASYLLIKGQKTESKEMVKTSMEFWFPQLQAVLEGKSEDEDADPVDVCRLPFNSRITTAKLLIELGDFDTALEVLEALFSEDDEDLMVWYLSGLANYSKGRDYEPTAMFYLQKASTLLKEIGEDNFDVTMEEMNIDVERLILAIESSCSDRSSLDTEASAAERAPSKDSSVYSDCEDYGGADPESMES